jgi:hypothetical protein
MLVCAAAHAVYLSSDGHGQALIYPYYTVRSSGEGSFNTYISITNTGLRPRALKLRLREGKSGASAGEINVYLGGTDMWAGALVPDAGGVRIVTADRSCTNPAIPADGLVIPPPTIDDGQGNDPDRVREGYVEVLEMAMLQGDTALAVSTFGCARVREVPITPQELAAPGGGLLGSATLINVRGGRSISYAATALDALATKPYFSQPVNGVAFPDGSASTLESDAIAPVSVITIGDATYRSIWTRGVDAVSAVLMMPAVEGEYILDPTTASKTDWVITMPTRNAYVRPGSESHGVFMAQLPGKPCDGVYGRHIGRDTIGATFDSGFGVPTPSAPLLCSSSTVFSLSRAFAGSPLSATDVLGSASTKFYVPAESDNGWGRLEIASWSVSPLSTMSFSATTGQASPVDFNFGGLPIIGFSVSTYENGFLDCAGSLCKGTYGALVPLRPWRVVY